MPSGLLAQSGPASAAAGASRAGRGPKAQTWTSAFLSNGDYDFSEGFTEYDYDNHAFAIGADYLVGESTIAGFMASYADSAIDEIHAVASADIESWTGGLYATHFRGALYVEGGLTYSTQSFANRRTLLVGAEERMAQSEHDGSALMLFAGAGREYDFGSWQVEPYGSLHYFNIDEDAFQETGADSLNLIFESKSTDVLLGEVGARFVRLQPIRNGELDWHATLAYNHDFDLDDGSIAYAYQGEPGSLLQVGDRNATAGSAVIAAGVAYIRGRSTVALDYRGQFSSAYRNNLLALRLSLAF
jgi:outer membrane autotransporter protein